MSSARKMLTIRTEERSDQVNPDRAPAEVSAAQRRRLRSDWMIFLRFLAVGGLNTAFGYFSYAAFVLAGAPTWLAVGSSTLSAILFNFFSYGGLVFGSTSLRLIPRFLAFYAGLGAVNFVLLSILGWGGLGPLWAQALLLPVLAGVGFVGMRRFVFHGGSPGMLAHLKAGDGES
jgi:putative flippase GtrA